MIYPKQNRLFRWILFTYGRYALKRYFHAINFNNIEIDPVRPVLLIANHFSRWDGMVLYRVMEQLCSKKLHVMLLEKTARENPMLKYGGAFSIGKGSKDILLSLDHAAQLLADPGNLVLIFPQGKLYSNFIDAVDFEKGILRIMQAAGDRYQLVYAATFIENFARKKPVANVYLHIETDSKFAGIEMLIKSYQQHYQSAKQQQIQITQ